MFSVSPKDTEKRLNHDLDFGTPELSVHENNVQLIILLGVSQDRSIVGYFAIMVYNTKFKGKFKVAGEISQEVIDLINGLARTRRMKRDTAKLAEFLGISQDEVEEKYLSDAQLYISPSDTDGDDRIAVVDNNSPPSDQPSLWCHWIYDVEKKAICWDKGEKFYFYTEWLEYLMRVVIIPAGLSVEGKVTYRGDDEDDQGYIEVKDNEVTRYVMQKVYVPEDKSKRYKGSV